MNEIPTFHRIIISVIVVTALVLLLENASMIYEPRTQDAFSLFTQFGGDRDHGNFLAASEKFVREPALFWKIRPRYKCSYYNVFKHAVVTESTNSRGFRGSAEYGQKTGNTFRILALGDSWTYGVWVADDETYPFLLSQCLDTRHSKDRAFEVLNLGCVGYSSFQGKVLLAKCIDEFQPDLVTVCFGGNDGRRNKFFADKDQPAIGRGPLLAQRLLHRSAFYTILRNRIMGLKARRFPRGDASSSPAAWPLRVSPEDYRNNLEDIISLCARRNARAILLLYAWGGYRDRAEEVSLTTGVPLIDIHRILNENPEYRVEELSIDYPRDKHPNARGHSLIAMALCDMIETMLHEKR